MKTHNPAVAALTALAADAEFGQFGRAVLALAKESGLLKATKRAKRTAGGPKRTRRTKAEMMAAHAVEAKAMRPTPRQTAKPNGYAPIRKAKAAKAMPSEPLQTL